MTSYEAYGIRFVSDLLFPELPSPPCPGGGAGATLVVRLKIQRRVDFDSAAVFLRTDNPAGQGYLICARSHGGYVMQFVGVADFFVGEGGDSVELWGMK